jgi:hypothetical protein
LDTNLYTKIAARKETYSRFMQSKDETNTDILDEVKKKKKKKKREREKEKS